MQVARPWKPPAGPLLRLSSASAERAAVARAHAPFSEQFARALQAPAGADILSAMSASRGVNVIAELKRRSPSKGDINAALDARQQVSAYAAGGASAVSILTEPTEFGGSLEDLQIAATLRLVPCIRKDFITDAVQLVEARHAGASAALLIARAMPSEQLAELVSVARTLGIEPLVEVRDENELFDALMSGALLIGVNNRDLETLEVELHTCERLVPLIPITHTAVYESGVTSRADVERAASYGADAVLVGSSVSASPSPADAVRALTGVARATRRA